MNDEPKNHKIVHEHNQISQQTSIMNANKTNKMGLAIR